MEILEGSLGDGALKESVAKDPNKLKMFAKVLLNSQYNDYSLTLFVLNIQFNLIFIVLIAYYQLSPFDHYIVV